MDDHTKPLEKQDNDNNVKFFLTLLNLELMSSSWILQNGKYTMVDYQATKLSLMM